MVASRKKIRGVRLGISRLIAVAVIIIIIIASVGVVILATSASVHGTQNSTQTTVSTSTVTSIQTQTSTSTFTSSYTNPNASSSVSSTTTSSAISGLQVIIVDFAFSPSNITVVIGVNNTITWTNKDIATHTVTAIDGAFDSGDLNTNQSWTHTFTTPGTYAYECTIHPWMTGTLIVESG